MYIELFQKRRTAEHIESLRPYCTLDWTSRTFIVNYMVAVVLRILLRYKTIPLSEGFQVFAINIRFKMSTSDLSSLSTAPSSDEELSLPTLKLKQGKLTIGAGHGYPPSSPEALCRQAREASLPHQFVLADNPDIAVSSPIHPVASPKTC